jgi:hypothetical protein
MANDRGQYGHSGHSAIPWLLGGAGLAVGLAMIGAHAARRSHLSEHEREVRAWEAEFPGLPWYMDQVKSSEQLDTWERARDYWEKTH